MIEVKVNNQKYYFEITSTFTELKKTILEETGRLPKKLWSNDTIITNGLSPKLFEGKLLVAEVDNITFDSYGENSHSFRCSICRRNVDLNSFVCNHTSGCKSSRSKSKNAINNSFLSGISSVKHQSDILETSLELFSECQKFSLNANAINDENFPAENNLAQQKTNNFENSWDDLAIGKDTKM
jgi:hypothetical protein